jgi:hypothetical protein
LKPPPNNVTTAKSYKTVAHSFAKTLNMVVRQRKIYGIGSVSSRTLNWKRSRKSGFEAERCELKKVLAPHKALCRPAARSKTGIDGQDCN